MKLIALLAAPVLAVMLMAAPADAVEVKPKPTPTVQTFRIKPVPGITTFRIRYNRKETRAAANKVDYAALVGGLCTFLPAPFPFPCAIGIGVAAINVSHTIASANRQKQCLQVVISLMPPGMHGWRVWHCNNKVAGGGGGGGSF